jgi:tyrosyl-tRNA synthetase
MDLFEDLTWRGAVHQSTEGVRELLAQGPVTAYIGFDPTADSLHVGSLIPALMLARLQRAGHAPIAVVGGGTGRIGDPSGKSDERKLLAIEDLERNVAGIRKQLGTLIDFGAKENAARMVDNAEWLTTISFTDFLRDVGKHFTVNYMLGKESVSRRLESEQGISYTEFSYLLLQAYDYLVLHDRHGCRLQMGGSDQWGNITAGCELIRRLRGERVQGLVFPLLTNTSGTKFGKTEAGTVWLDPRRTSPYAFYQFWLNTDDADVGRHLRLFTFRPRIEIESLDQATAQRPEKREAQDVLAADVTRLVHGEEGLRRARAATQALFGRGENELSPEVIRSIENDVPRKDFLWAYMGQGLGAIELLHASGIASSKGEARRLIQGGGVYLNGQRLVDPEARILPSDAQKLDGALLFRKGQRSYYVVRFVTPDKIESDS